jgi:hypothetical protein
VSLILHTSPIATNLFRFLLMNGSSNRAATPPSSPTPPPALVVRQRRSARVLQHDPIVAPGFGTVKDLERLAQQLSSVTSSSGSNSISKTAVFTSEIIADLMKARGRGARSSTRGQDDVSTKCIDRVYVLQDVRFPSGSDVLFFINNLFYRPPT